MSKLPHMGQFVVHYPLPFAHAAVIPDSRTAPGRQLPLYFSLTLSKNLTASSDDNSFGSAKACNIHKRRWLFDQATTMCASYIVHLWHCTVSLPCPRRS